MTYNSGPSLVLCELWERESKAGRQYFSGFLGGLSLALLRVGEQPHPSRPGEVVTVWRLVAQEREPREGRQKPPARPPGRDQAPAPTIGPSGAGARPDGPQQPQRRFRREGKAAQRERVAGEVAAAYGLGDRDPDDALPF
jgi:hypothetical protein